MEGTAPIDISVLVPLNFIITFGIPLLKASMPVWGISGIIIKMTPTYRFCWQDVVLYLVGIFMCGWVAFSDFAGLLTWLAD